MSRPLSSSSLCSQHKLKLASAGYVTEDDLRNVRVTHLSRELGIPLAEAAEILRVAVTKNNRTDSNDCELSSDSKGVSALDLLQAEQELNHIVTFSAKIDSMLGGGVPVTKITEFCGAPGIGKTQMSIQLAVDATLPVVFGGCGGDSIYIDTEGSFIIERVVQIATAAVSHIQSVAKSTGDSDMIAEAAGYTLENILGRIHYYRCHTHVQLIALSNILQQIIEKLDNKVCLVVVDSIAGPFRRDFKDMGLRHRLLSGLAQNFIKLATQFKLAVVLTNQMTTRSSGGSSSRSQLIPALGESWGHACTIRVILYWEGTERLAFLYKSPSNPETIAPYQITKDGVRDVLDEGAKSGIIPLISCNEDYQSVQEDDWSDEMLLQLQDDNESVCKLLMEATDDAPPFKRLRPLEP